MIEGKYSDAIAKAVIILLGGQAFKQAYVPQPGDGYYRAEVRLAKHRAQWNNTPVNMKRSRQVRRAEMRQTLKNESIQTTA